MGSKGSIKYEAKTLATLNFKLNVFLKIYKNLKKNITANWMVVGILGSAVSLASF